MDKVSILHQKLSEQEEYLAPHFREICYSAMEEYASLRLSELEERIKVLEEWIPVSERRPENHNLVLVILKSGANTIGRLNNEGTWDVFKINGVYIETPVLWKPYPHHQLTT